MSTSHLAEPSSPRPANRLASTMRHFRAGLRLIWAGYVRNLARQGELPRIS
jgi:hypothetical protein